MVNRPTGSDIIALDAPNTATITFSKPVSNVFIAFNIYNDAQVTFSQPFTVVSEGCGYWGCGNFVASAGNTSFFGDGGTTGILEFTGRITSITMTDTVWEYWHGFTVGIGNIAAVPEPGSWAMMLVGFGAIGFALRRRDRTIAIET